MAKKIFSPESTDSLLDTLTGSGHPDIQETSSEDDHKKSPRRSVSSDKKGIKEHVSTMMEKEQMAKLRYISGKHNIPITDLFSKAVSDLLDSYEQKNGIIRLSKTKKDDIDSLF